MSTATVTPQTISAAGLRALHQQGKSIDLIDVRTPAEFREIHVEFARSVPLDQLNPAALMQARGSSSEPLYVVCKSGGRGKQACDQFVKAGYTNVVNVEGGTTACEQVGLPVVRGQKTISLERQVRIAAGSLVLVGTVLAYFVHPGFMAIPAFVGSGLIFAGITDTCGMGLMLAKMPWNQCGKSSNSCCSR